MGWTSATATLGLTFQLTGCGIYAPEGSAAFEWTPQVRLHGKV
jgi:hypothetical protein